MNLEHLKQMRVMVVDDDHEIVTGMETMLKANVAGLCSAHDGEEGLETYRRERPDIVLTDIQMPKMNGIALTEAIKHENEEACVLLITAFGDEHRLMQAIDAGADAYIKKPLSPLSVLNKLDRFARSLDAKRMEMREEQLRIQNLLMRAKAQVIQDIAHHWRQPLNLIGIVFGEVQDYLWHELKINDEYLQEETKKIGKLLDELSQSISKFQHLYHHTRDVAIPIILFELLEEVLALFRPSLNEHGIVIEISKMPSDLSISGFPAPLGESLVAIVKNALDAYENRKPEAPILSFMAEQIDGETVQLRIRDNFGGIDEAVLGAIFDPYSTTKFPERGVGLSLFFAKEIIENQLHGKLQADNCGQGAEFVIELPVAVPSPDIILKGSDAT